MTMQEMQDTLEEMLDADGSADPAEMVANVLRALSVVCDEKENHVRSTWGDIVLAKEWARAATSLDNAASRIGLGVRVPVVPVVK